MFGVALGMIFGGIITVVVSCTLAASKSSKLEEEFYDRERH